MPQLSEETLPSLRDYLTVQRWLRDKADKTQVNYLARMTTFTERSGLTPDSFLAWAKTVESVEVQDLIEKTSMGLKPGTAFNFKTDMRSFLLHNGFNNLPRAKNSYVLQDWHPGYKRSEVKSLLGYLDNLPHKLYVTVAVETGLRAKTILDIQYHHIKQDFEAGLVPCAIRFEPKYYGKKKSAGYTFLGERSIGLYRSALEAGLVKSRPESPVIPLGYYGAYDALARAREKAKLDPKIQTNHGLRKYFEDALDRAGVDHEKKMMIEGHFAGTRAKHYTDRDWDQLRTVYRQAYPFIDVEAGSVEVAQKIQSSEDKIQSLERKVANLTATLQKLLEDKRGGQA